jgi:hypothetical protein
MNDSKVHNQSEANTTVDSFYSLEYILTNFAASTWPTDNFNFWPFVTVGPTAALLNALAFLILQDPEFDLKLYQYMRVYTANNAILSIFLTFNWINCCIRIIPWTNSELAQSLSIYFDGNIINALYFFGSLIDLLMLVDRIGIFKNKIKNIIKISPYKMCAIAFVFMVVVDAPFFFVLVVAAPLPFKLNATSTYIVWSYTNSAFANSELGIVLTYVVFAIRDVIVGLAQISLNFAVIVYFKQYVQNRHKIILKVPTQPPIGTNEITTRNQQRPTIASNAQASQSRSVSVVQQERVSSADKRATVMCIIMCVLSFIEHLLVFASVVYPYFSSNYLNSLLIYSCSFLWQILKRIADFFLLFFINKVFRKVCLKFLRIN